MLEETLTGSDERYGSVGDKSGVEMSVCQMLGSSLKCLVCFLSPGYVPVMAG